MGSVPLSREVFFVYSRNLEEQIDRVSFLGYPLFQLFYRRGNLDNLLGHEGG